MSYQIWAIFSAVAAALTALLIKKGVEDVPTNLAVAIRVTVVVVAAWAVALVTRETEISKISTRTWWFLGTSGLATGISWYCYIHALKLGPVSRVAPIDKLSFVLAMILGIMFLGEKISWNAAIGACLIVIGVVLTLN